MEIKIPELLKSLTMAVISQKSMPDQLYEWLNMDSEVFYKDICNYIDLREGKYSKKEIEDKIAGGPGEEGLMMLMEFYNNEWTVDAKNESGEVVEMSLYEAMDINNVDYFQDSWKLEELDSNWNADEITLVDEDDGYDVSYYALDSRA